MHLRLTVSAILLSAAGATQFGKFVADFTLLENTGRMGTCNLVTCWGQGTADLVKEISRNFRCYVAANPPERPLSEWFVDSNLQLFVVDLGCSRTRQFLKEAEDFGAFNGNLVWLVVNTAEGTGTASSNGTSSAEVFRDVYVTVSSQVNIADRVSRDKFELTGVYKRDAEGVLISEKLGYWTEDEGLVYTAVSCPTVRRQDMEGRVFKGSIVLTTDDSLNHFHDLVDVQIDNPSKIGYVTYDLAVQALNGSIELLVTREWGEKINGTFNGMIGQLASGESELLITPTFVTYERMEVLTYVGLTVNYRIRFVFLSPPLSYKNNIFFLTFDAGVWYCCFALFVSSVIFMYVVAVYEEEYGIQKDLRNNTTVSPLTRSYSDLIMMHVGTICQQDVSMEPKAIGGRIAILHVKAAVVFLYVSYSAAILVLLQTPDRTIDTLGELDRSNLKIGVYDTPYNRFYFKTARTADDLVRKRLADKAKREQDFMEARVGLKKVKSGLFAFHAETDSVYMLAAGLLDDSEKCRLQELHEPFVPPVMPLVGVRRNLPYTEFLTAMFKKVNEVGLVDRERHRKTSKKVPCNKSMTFWSVGILDSRAIFLLLASGMLSSVTVFALEVGLHKLKRRRISEFQFAD